MSGDQNLGNGGHPDDVRAHRAQHAILGSRFEGRSRDRDVDTTMQGDVQLHRHLHRERLQLTVVRLGHVGKAWPQLVEVRPDQRAVHQEIDVVVEQDDAAGFPERVHSSARC